MEHQTAPLCTETLPSASASTQCPHISRWKPRNAIFLFCPQSYNHSSTAAAAAAMAAFRRVAALAGKLNLWSAARNELVGGQTASGGRARRCMAVGMCLATGGAVALYFYSDMTSGRGRKRMGSPSSISGLLPSIPTVEAKEKVGPDLNCAAC